VGSNEEKVCLWLTVNEGTFLKSYTLHLNLPTYIQYIVGEKTREPTIMSEFIVLIKQIPDDLLVLVRF